MWLTESLGHHQTSEDFQYLIEKVALKLYHHKVVDKFSYYCNWLDGKPEDDESTQLYLEVHMTEGYQHHRDEPFKQSLLPTIEELLYLHNPMIRKTSPKNMVSKEFSPQRYKLFMQAHAFEREVQTIPSYEDWLENQEGSFDFKYQIKTTRYLLEEKSVSCYPNEYIRLPRGPAD